MKYISITPPITITEAMLVSSNVAEDDYPAYAPATTYTVGVRCIYAHFVYECAQACTGQTPSASSAYWTKVGPTNRWRCFDSLNSTQTVTDGGTTGDGTGWADAAWGDVWADDIWGAASTPSISYELSPGEAVTLVSVASMTGAHSVSVTITDPVYGIVYSKTVGDSGISGTAGWFEFFFGIKNISTQQTFPDLPIYPSATIKIEITGDTSLAVGVILLGRQMIFSMGARYGASPTRVDYSIKETDEYGAWKLVKRGNARKITCKIILTSEEFDRFDQFCASITTIPCLWRLSSRFEAMSVYGIYKTITPVINGYNYQDCDLEILGLT